MFRKLLALTALLTLLAVSAGYAEMNQSRLELDYGTSAKLAKFNQILNLDADKNMEPVSGLDGKAADGNIKKYVKGFEKPAKEPVYSFSIGGGK